MKFSVYGKSYGTKRVLAPISFEIEPERVTVLMGSSGSGKTTLLRIITGLEKDDAGSTQPNLKFGMMFQEPRLLPWMTLRENVEIAGPADDFLEELGLREATHLYPRQISLGMARRVAFARAIAAHPDVLILDEPFASLDPELVDVISKKILAYAQYARIPILVTTHQAANAVALRARQMHLEGTPAQLRSYD